MNRHLGVLCISSLMFMLLLVGVSSVHGQAAYSVNWYINEAESGYVTRLFHSSGFEIIDKTGLLFQLVADVDGNTDFAGMLAAGAGLEGWAIGSEHSSSAHYAADDDIVIATESWETITSVEGGLSAVTNRFGDSFNNTLFYFRWMNTDSVATATEAGVIYRSNGDWVTGPEIWVTPSEPIYAPLDYGISTNLGSAKTNSVAGWQSMPRAFLTSQGTPVRWFVDHSVALEAGDTWDDADFYDSDTNGIPDRSEYIAGTDPMDPDSVLEIKNISITTNTSNWNLQFSWLGGLGGATNTSWSMLCSTNHLASANWDILTNGVWDVTGTGTNGWSAEVSPMAGAPVLFQIKATIP